MKITVEPFHHEFECEDGETLLKAALRQGLFIRYGCKHGGCGTCKSRLLDGDIDEPPSTFCLSPAEREDDWFLPCVSTPTDDCTIDIGSMGISQEEFLAGDQSREYETRIEINEPLTKDIRRLRLRIVDEDEMKFTAGQFANIQVPGTQHWRPYSMANSPEEKNFLEFIVKIFPEGRFSKLLEDRLNTGDRLQVHGPYGELRIRLSHRNIIMVAGGSGLAPLLSMLNRLAEKGNERPVQFFFGARTNDDLYYIKEIEAVVQTMPVLEFIPVLSDSWPGDWRGETGLVTEALARHRESYRNCDAYLCGPPPMIDAATSLLLERGVRPRNVYFDAFYPATSD